MEEFKDFEEKIQNENRTLVFGGIEAPKPYASVFDRLKSCNQARLSSNLNPCKFVFKRLGSLNLPFKQTHRGEFKDDLKDDEIHSSIPSRMKRQSSLIINTNGDLKVI